MNLFTSYSTLSQLILHYSRGNEDNYRPIVPDLYYFFRRLYRSLLCYVCDKLLSDPVSPVDGQCEHHLCECCLEKKADSGLRCKCNADDCVYTDNESLRALIGCFKKMCEFTVCTGLYEKLLSDYIADDDDDGGNKPFKTLSSDIISILHWITGKDTINDSLHRKLKFGNYYNDNNNKSIHLTRTRTPHSTIVPATVAGGPVTTTTNNNNNNNNKVNIIRRVITKNDRINKRNILQKWTNDRSAAAVVVANKTDLTSNYNNRDSNQPVNIIRRYVPGGRKNWNNLYRNDDGSISYNTAADDSKIYRGDSSGITTTTTTTTSSNNKVNIVRLIRRKNKNNVLHYRNQQQRLKLNSAIKTTDIYNNNKVNIICSGSEHRANKMLHGGFDNRCNVTDVTAHSIITKNSTKTTGVGGDGESRIISKPADICSNNKVTIIRRNEDVKNNLLRYKNISKYNNYVGGHSTLSNNTTNNNNNNNKVAIIKRITRNKENDSILHGRNKLNNFHRASSRSIIQSSSSVISPIIAAANNRDKIMDTVNNSIVNNNCIAVVDDAKMPPKTASVESSSSSSSNLSLSTTANGANNTSSSMKIYSIASAPSSYCNKLILKRKLSTAGGAEKYEPKNKKSVGNYRLKNYYKEDDFILTTDMSMTTATVNRKRLPQYNNNNNIKSLSLVNNDNDDELTNYNNTPPPSSNNSVIIPVVGGRLHVDFVQDTIDSSADIRQNYVDLKISDTDRCSSSEINVRNNSNNNYNGDDNVKQNIPDDERSTTISSTVNSNEEKILPTRGNYDCKKKSSTNNSPFDTMNDEEICAWLTLTSQKYDEPVTTNGNKTSYCRSVRKRNRMKRAQLLFIKQNKDAFKATLHHQDRRKKPAAETETDEPIERKKMQPKKRKSKKKKRNNIGKKGKTSFGEETTAKNMISILSSSRNSSNNNSDDDQKSDNLVVLCAANVNNDVSSNNLSHQRNLPSSILDDDADDVNLIVERDRRNSNNNNNSLIASSSDDTSKREEENIHTSTSYDNTVIVRTPAVVNSDSAENREENSSVMKTDSDIILIESSGVVDTAGTLKSINSYDNTIIVRTPAVVNSDSAENREENSSVMKTDSDIIPIESSGVVDTAAAATLKSIHSYDNTIIVRTPAAVNSDSAENREENSSVMKTDSDIIPIESLGVVDTAAAATLKSIHSYDNTIIVRTPAVVNSDSAENREENSSSSVMKTDSDIILIESSGIVDTVAAAAATLKSINSYDNTVIVHTPAVVNSDSAENREENSSLMKTDSDIIPIESSGVVDTAAAAATSKSIHFSTSYDNTVIVRTPAVVNSDSAENREENSSVMKTDSDIILIESSGVVDTDALKSIYSSTSYDNTVIVRTPAVVNSDSAENREEKSSVMKTDESDIILIESSDVVDTAATLNATNLSIERNINGECESNNVIRDNNNFEICIADEVDSLAERGTYQSLLVSNEDSPVNEYKISDSQTDFERNDIDDDDGQKIVSVSLLSTTDEGVSSTNCRLPLSNNNNNNNKAILNNAEKCIEHRGKIINSIIDYSTSCNGIGFFTDVKTAEVNLQLSSTNDSSPLKKIGKKNRNEHNKLATSIDRYNLRASSNFETVCRQKPPVVIENNKHNNNSSSSNNDYNSSLERTSLDISSGATLAYFKSFNKTDSSSNYNNNNNNNDGSNDETSLNGDINPLLQWSGNYESMVVTDDNYSEDSYLSSSKQNTTTTTKRRYNKATTKSSSSAATTTARYNLRDKSNSRTAAIDDEEKKMFDNKRADLSVTKNLNNNASTRYYSTNLNHQRLDYFHRDDAYKEKEEEEANRGDDVDDSYLSEKNNFLSKNFLSKKTNNYNNSSSSRPSIPNNTELSKNHLKERTNNNNNSAVATGGSTVLDDVGKYRVLLSNPSLYTNTTTEEDSSDNRSSSDVAELLLNSDLPRREIGTSSSSLRYNLRTTTITHYNNNKAAGLNGRQNSKYNLRAIQPLQKRGVQPVVFGIGNNNNNDKSRPTTLAISRIVPLRDEDSSSVSDFPKRTRRASFVMGGADAEELQSKLILKPRVRRLSSVFKYDSQTCFEDGLHRLPSRTDFVFDSKTNANDDANSQIIKKNGCRCGSSSYGNRTCCGSRCPCFASGKSCNTCRCKGCKNPIISDEFKNEDKLTQDLNTGIT